MPQYLYCFESTFDIEKKFDRTNKKPSDYAVYKIGKTTRDIDERLKEHGKRVKDVKFKKIVYDCDTLERDLIDFLKKNKNLIFRPNLSSKEDGDLKNIKGLEYFEGSYAIIELILDEIVSESYQCSKPRNMDIDYTCHICNRDFSDRGALKRHVRLHNDGTIIDDSYIKKGKTEILPPRDPSERLKGKTRKSYRERSTSLSPSPKSPPKPSPKSPPKPPPKSPPKPPPKPPSPKPSPKPPSPRPPSPKLQQYQARSNKHIFFSDFNTTSAPLHTSDYTNNTNLSTSFLDLIEKLNLDEKNKRKRLKTKPKISPNTRSYKRSRTIL